MAATEEGAVPSDRISEYLGRLIGPEVVTAMRDRDVTEIYANPDGKLWVDCHGRGRVFTGKVLSAASVMQFLNVVASTHATTLTAEQPSLQAELPDEFWRRARLQGEIPPIVSGPCFNLRKPPTEIYPLEDYVEKGILTPRWYEAIRVFVKEVMSFLVVGPTHSGKTTFCNALIREMVEQYPTKRFVIIEDTPELQCAAEDKLELRTHGDVTMRQLVKFTMRHSPDRIIVGEVRDAAAFDLCDAWSTGHPGGCGTVHAGSAAGALARMDRLCRQANVPSQVEMIAEAVNVVVVLKPTPQGRRVTELTLVKGLDERGRYITETLPQEGDAP